MKNYPRVAIVDFKLGNLFSVYEACKHTGLDAVLTSDPKIISQSDGVILPGVGAFGDAMNFMRDHGLDFAVTDFIKTGKPFLGICLGMQLLCDDSQEFGHSRGLGIVPGRVTKLPVQKQDEVILKIPQVGWNQIHSPTNTLDCWTDTPLADIPNGSYFYFVHSFYCAHIPEENILTQTTYGDVTYCSGLRFGNAYAFQFHPEKSSELGLRIYSNWKKSF